MRIAVKSSRVSTLSTMAIADSARGATSVIIQPMSRSISSRLWRMARVSAKAWARAKKKIGKGGKDANRATEPKKQSALNYCDRCNREHMGLVGDSCVQPPCRFCTSQQMQDVDHHLRYCTLAPDNWQWQPGIESNPKSGSKRELTTRVNTALNSGKKQKPMTAMELVTSLSVNELAEVCAAINTRQNEDASAVVEQESEAIQVLTKLNRTTPVAKSAGSTLKGGDTTHLVPVTATGMKATATIGSVIRRGPINAKYHSRLHRPKSMNPEAAVTATEYYL
jgi:hypothetical protein